MHCVYTTKPQLYSMQVTLMEALTKEQKCVYLPLAPFRGTSLPARAWARGLGEGSLSLAKVIIRYASQTVSLHCISPASRCGSWVGPSDCLGFCCSNAICALIETIKCDKCRVKSFSYAIFLAHSPRSI